MIINNTHKFIFIHVPKAAGTSLSSALATLSTWKDLEIGSTQFGQEIHGAYAKRWKLTKHQKASVVKNVVGEEWDNYFKFAFVRHPVDRAKSLFHFLQRWRDWEKYDKVLNFNSLDEFILSPDFGFEKESFHLTRASSFYLDEDLDFIGRTEQLEADLAYVLRTLDIPEDKRPKPKRLNETRRAQETSLSKEAREKLQVVWKYDFDLYETAKN